MYPRIFDYTSTDPLDFDRLRNEVVTGSGYAPSFGMRKDLQQQIDMLEREFSGQLRLKLVHAVLNVLLRRGVATQTVYGHFATLWAEHADILLDTLDSRWLVSACDTICDHSPDPAEAQGAILVSLFVNTLKLAETERLMDDPAQGDPQRIAGRTPLFDGMVAFLPGRGDMPANLLQRLDRRLRPETLTGMIGRELINRALSADTVFTRLAVHQTRNLWRPYLASTPAPGRSGPREARRAILDADRPGYVLLNDTSRLGDNFHLGTVYACESIRRNLARRGLQEIGWANDRKRFETLLADGERKPALIVLNGEGTLHHGAARAVELLALCVQAKEQGIRVAVLNSVWEKNPDAMVAALRKVDLVHVRDKLSREALPDGFPAEVTPDMSMQLFLQSTRTSQFPPPQHKIGVMDSVLPAASEALLGFAEEEGLPFYAMPGRNLRSTRVAVAARSGPVWPRLLQLTDLMAAEAWVTGRFHGLIAALSAGLPVCAVSSNTSKIEGLLDDAGLNEACLLPPEWLSAPGPQKRRELVKRFQIQQTSEFIQRREIYLEAAVQRIDQMFDSTAALAKGDLPSGRPFAKASHRIKAFGKSLGLQKLPGI